jgi:hypothetical protein
MQYVNKVGSTLRARRSTLWVRWREERCCYEHRPANTKQCQPAPSAATRCQQGAAPVAVMSVIIVNYSAEEAIFNCEKSSKKDSVRHNIAQ